MKFPNRIDTKSNLNSKVLKEICEKFLFNFNAFSTYTSDIDRLVGIRNAIAHGENSMLPGIDNIMKYIESVNGAIDKLTQEISRFVEQEDYLVKAVA